MVRSTAQFTMSIH